MTQQQFIAVLVIPALGRQTVGRSGHLSMKKPVFMETVIPFHSSNRQL